MKIFVLGGDGFCGWPTALYLSARGHDVRIIDNLSRRAIDRELGTHSLTPIRPFQERCRAADIPCTEMNVAQEHKKLRMMLDIHRPDVIVHFAEQRAAPYSMKNSDTRRYTVNNNLRATHNVLDAMVEAAPQAHLVHLGTMGVYGYGGGAVLPEGYVDASIAGQRRGIVFPPDPGSIYHCTKVLDHQLFQTYAKLYGLRITDLHQGIVWGTQTPETALDERLINRFDWCGDYGTVLNRFLVQAAIGYPLTVHGTGGQTRAFIHIKDTVRCIEAALHAEPRPDGRPTIINQFTEMHRVRDLAKLVAGLTGAAISYVPNPRKEADENELEAHSSACGLIGNPTTLADGLLTEVVDIARKYADRIDRSRIPCTSLWAPRRDLHPVAAE